MKQFIEWADDRGQAHDHMLAVMQQKLQAIDHIDNCFDNFLTNLTRDHAPVAYAYKKYKHALEALQATVQTAIQKDTHNPERHDHPPKTIQQDPRDSD